MQVSLFWSFEISFRMIQTLWNVMDLAAVQSGMNSVVKYVRVAASAEMPMCHSIMHFFLIKEQLQFSYPFSHMHL